MRSTNKLNLMILSTITLILITESQGTILSKEKKKELEKQLNQINKPAVKSFQSKHGYILDCIDIKKQVAFDHPLLKNHSIQLKPMNIPKRTNDNTTSTSYISLPFQQADDISCPLGTVIIKRTTLEELIQYERLQYLGTKPTSKDTNNDPSGYHSAVAQYYYKGNLGTMANINVWDLHMKPDQFSLACVYLKSGFREKLEFMSAGWIVSPKLNQNHSGIFTSWRTNGKICYNTLCPGFVQVSRTFALGHLVKPSSTYNGQQYILEVFMFLEESENWWLVIKGEPIGYWPGSLFNANGLRYKADRVYWGGEVFSAVRPSISPFMGSGYFPRDGFKRAAYINGLRVLEPVSKKVRIPSPKTFTFYVNSPNCYNVKARSGVGEHWSSYIFFGGPGGCTN